MNVVKWGIIGSGFIANKFAENIKSVENAKLVACSSKDFNRAYEFKKKHNIEYSYGNYEDMLKNAPIDAVYIATTHNFHYQNALLCIVYGKHILCEKAFTLNAKQANEIFEKAKERNLFVMEGMWTRFLPTTKWVKEQIGKGEIGEIVSAFAEFGVKFLFDPLSRAFNKNLAGGGLLDLGIYALSFACNILGNNPVKITGVAKIGETGVDEQASISLLYKDGQTATITYSMVVEYDNSATIYGTSGKIILNHTSRPTKAKLIKYPVSEGNLEDNEKLIEFESTSLNGFENEIKEATNLILQGESQSPSIKWIDTLRIMEICDNLRAQWNFIYPDEE